MSFNENINITLLQLIVIQLKIRNLILVSILCNPFSQLFYFYGFGVLLTIPKFGAKMREPRCNQQKGTNFAHSCKCIGWRFTLWMVLCTYHIIVDRMTIYVQLNIKK